MRKDASGDPEYRMTEKAFDYIDLRKKLNSYRSETLLAPDDENRKQGLTSLTP